LHRNEIDVHNTAHLAGMQGEEGVCARPGRLQWRGACLGEQSMVLLGEDWSGHLLAPFVAFEAF